MEKNWKKYWLNNIKFIQQIYHPDSGRFGNISRINQEKKKRKKTLIQGDYFHIAKNKKKDIFKDLDKGCIISKRATKE